MLMLQQGKSRLEAYQTLGIDRVCCRAVEMTVIPYEHMKQQIRHNVHDTPGGKVRMTTLRGAAVPRTYSTD